MKHYGAPGDYDIQKAQAPEPTAAEECAAGAAEERIDQAFDRLRGFQAGGGYVGVACEEVEVTPGRNCCDAGIVITLTITCDSPDWLDRNLLSQVFSELAHSIGGGA